MYYRWIPEFLLDLQMSIFSKQNFLKRINEELDKKTIIFNFNNFKIKIYNFQLKILQCLFKLIIKIFH